MCFGKCAKCIGYKLLIFAVFCMVANILLYFPNGETRYASEYRLSKYTRCLHGIVGGGLLVTLFLEEVLWHKPLLLFCGNRCMLSSVLAAFIGILGSGYCIIISALGLSHGPYCLASTENAWIYPFHNSSGEYLLERNRWSECQEPRNIVEWNVTLFSILLFLGGVEFILCSIQVINGFIGGVYEMCCHREEVTKDLEHCWLQVVLISTAPSVSLWACLQHNLLLMK
uniref:Transmembrane 4 L six family member 1 n=1 Tax=Crocodylus porosus TaxID=8502 RepID=A0A7M4EGG0_CROPO